MTARKDSPAATIPATSPMHSGRSSGRRRVHLTRVDWLQILLVPAVISMFLFAMAVAK